MLGVVERATSLFNCTVFCCPFYRTLRPNLRLNFDRFVSSRLHGGSGGWGGGGYNHVVLVFGRGDNEDFQLKGYDIAARAIAELKDEPQPYKLLFVGAPSGEEEKVKDLLLQQGIDRSQLTVRCFSESREQLARLFCEVDLAIMPSRTEGFGLAALEALSAGLRVLVSGNSGLGEALQEVLNGSNCVVESEHRKDWANAIKAVRKKKRKLRLREAKVLQGEYAEIYRWQDHCNRLVERMLAISQGNRFTF